MEHGGVGLDGSPADDHALLCEQDIFKGISNIVSKVYSPGGVTPYTMAARAPSQLLNYLPT